MNFKTPPFALSPVKDSENHPFAIRREDKLKVKAEGDKHECNKW
jgi:hypothetical protein